MNGNAIVYCQKAKILYKQPNSQKSPRYQIDYAQENKCVAGVWNKGFISFGQVALKKKCFWFQSLLGGKQVHEVQQNCHCTFVSTLF